MTGPLITRPRDRYSADDLAFTHRHRHQGRSRWVNGKPAGATVCRYLLATWVLVVSAAYAARLCWKYLLSH